MIHLRRYFRLLPGIVVIGAGLLAIKGVDLARAQQAAALVAPDNRGLAPSDVGSAKPASNLATDDGPTVSAAEVDVLSSLTRRREQLDARERALNMRETLLAAGEGRVDQKIASLKSLQSQIQSLLSQRDAAQDKQIASLVKTYSAMKAKDAAHIFDTLADEVLLPVAKGMKSDVLAPVLGAMNREAAQQLTVKLAALLKLPETPADCAMTHAMMSESSIAPPPPVPATTAASPPPAPLQTAAIAAPQPVTPPRTPLTGATPAVSAPPAQAAALPPPKPRKLVLHKLVKPALAPADEPAAVAASPAAPPAEAAAETNVPSNKSEPSDAVASAPAASPVSVTTSTATTPPTTSVALPGASSPPAALAPTTAKGG